MSQIYWLKQKVDLKMKDGIAVSSHVNNFNSIFWSNQWQEKDRVNDSQKAFFLLLTLQRSRLTFRTTISNFAIVDGLSLAMVEISLLKKEVNKKNLDNSLSDNALYVCGRISNKVKSKEISKSNNKSYCQEFFGSGK